MQPGYGPPSAGERWNVNMPAVIGVVFVFLVGVVVWVIATSADSDDVGSASASTQSIVAAPTTSLATTGTPAPTLSPTPLPTSTTTTPPATTTSTTTPTTTPTTTSTTTSPTTSPTTTTADTSAPATTSEGSEPDVVAGDLDVPGQPMQRPPCDGAFITIVGSPVGEQATAVAVGAVLDQYPGTNYLRTDQTCPSLAPDAAGEPIYVIYFGPFAVASDACAARAEGPEDAYARTLSDELGPDHSVTCT